MPGAGGNPEGDTRAVRRAVVHYAIDANDVIVAAGGDWDAFAEANDGPSAMSVVGQPIWHFIADPETKTLWRHVFARCRSSAQPLQVRIRCDAPGVRRVIGMVLGARDGSITVDAVEEDATVREPLPLVVRPHSPDALVTICAWCHALRVENGWRPLEEALRDAPTLLLMAPPRLSHGACPACAAALQRLIQGDTNEATCG